MAMLDEQERVRQQERIRQQEKEEQQRLCQENRDTDKLEEKSSHILL